MGNNERNLGDSTNGKVVYVCINNNDNVEGEGSGTTPEPPPPPTPGQVCPAGTEFTVTEGIGICEGPNSPSDPSCTPPSTLNTETGQCERPPVSICPDGFEYSVEDRECQDLTEAVCQEGRQLNPLTGQCQRPPVSACPENTPFNPVNLRCESQTPPTCPTLDGPGANDIPTSIAQRPGGYRCVGTAENNQERTVCTNNGGTLDGNTCVLPEDRATCPTGTQFNQLTGKCGFAPSCTTGNLVITIGACLFTPTNACPAGAEFVAPDQCLIDTEEPSCTEGTLDEDTGECIFNPTNACPAGTVYNTNTQQCVTPVLSCPEGFDPVFVTTPEGEEVIVQCDEQQAVSQTSQISDQSQPIINNISVQNQTDLSQTTNESQQEDSQLKIVTQDQMQQQQIEKLKQTLSSLH